MNRNQAAALGEPGLQTKLPPSAPVFAAISMPGRCKNLQGIGFLVVNRTQKLESTFP